MLQTIIANLFTAPLTFPRYSYLKGNRRFRALVKSYLPTYSKCVTKVQKTRLVSTIIETVRYRSQGGGFVKNVEGKWYEVGDRRAKGPYNIAEGLCRFLALVLF